MTALELVHGVISARVGKGGFCIDATAGRGYDTAFLCHTVGKEGKVIAFDIQPEAIESTDKLLKKQGLSAELVLGSHENLAMYAEANSVDCIVFNLGYLPSGDHSIYTQPNSTIAAISAGLNLLKVGGLMCISVYYGGDSGYAERDTLLPWLENADSDKYQVLMTTFHNWKKDPPIPIFITRIA